MALESEKWFNPSRGEELLWYSHPSFIMHLPQILSGIIAALIAIIIAVYVYFFQDWPIELVYVLLLFVPVGLFYSGYQMLVFKNTWYVITNRQVIKKSQIVGQDKSSKPHREIVRVDTRVSLFEAIMSRLTAEDLGNIVIRTADDSGDKFILERVPEVSLAESYLNRLSGTGPDTPAQYDAEERERLKHEEVPGDNSTGRESHHHAPNSQHPGQDPHQGAHQTHGRHGEPGTSTPDPNRTSETPPGDDLHQHEPSSAATGETHTHSHSRDDVPHDPNDPYGEQNRQRDVSPPPESISDDDEMDQFEPSDRA